MERIISKYHFQRHTCPGWQSRKKLGDRAECAAAVLPLLAWLNLSATWVTKRGPMGARRPLWLPGTSKLEIPCEQLCRLGGGCTPRTLAAAKRTIDAIDVVGVTEHMDAALALAESTLGLVAGSASPTAHLRVNSKKPSVSSAVRREILSHRAVQLEVDLYAYAMRRFVHLLGRAGVAHLRGGPLLDTATAPRGGGRRLGHASEEGRRLGHASEDRTVETAAVALAAAVAATALVVTSLIASRLRSTLPVLGPVNNLLN